MRNVIAGLREFARARLNRVGGKPRRHTLGLFGADVLEDRLLLSATLQPIDPISVPALQGYTVPLEADTGATDPQNYTVTSSNPDIAASVAQGPFWTLGVSYTDPQTPSNSFTGSLTFQLFQTLTPNTVKMITQFTTDGFYTTSGKYFPRIVKDFGSPQSTVVQGGSNNVYGLGSSGQPNTPFANENVQQLALTGVDQLTLANAGGTDSNDTQFFINTGQVNLLGYNFTVFGQLVSGQDTLTKMTGIPLQNNQGTGEQGTQPKNPLTITSATLSNTNPDGVVIIDTTQAKQGETSKITVTATDPTDGTTAPQSFVVTVGAYSGPTTGSQIGNVNFRPYATPVTTSVAENNAVAVQLSGQNTYPDTTVTVPLSYSLVASPAHGSITNFNATTGSFTYTPAPGFVGTDTLQYTVTANGPNSADAAATSNATDVTFTVTGSPTPTPSPSPSPTPSPSPSPSPSPTPTPSPTPAPTQAPPLVSVAHVQLLTNRAHQVTQILVTFSGGLNSQEASSTGFYRLAHPGKKGSYTAKNAVVIKLKSATYSAINQAVSLTPKKPFPLTKQPIQLLIDGSGPSGLEDASGRAIDGAQNGQAGSNAIILISKSGANIV